LVVEPRGTSIFALAEQPTETKAIAAVGDDEENGLLHMR